MNAIESMMKGMMYVSYHRNRLPIRAGLAETWVDDLISERALLTTVVEPVQDPYRDENRSEAGDEGDEPEQR
jgi:hypothetical protein